MRFLITLAFKNLTRYKRRTAITAMAIAFGIMMYIMIDSMLGGAEYESVRNLKWYETSSIRLMHEEYWENRFQKPLDLNISGENSDAVLNLLRENGYTATPRITFGADMILNALDFGEEGNMPAVVTAIDPESDYDVFHYGDTLLKGRFLEPGEDGVLLGSWFAEDIGADIDYLITFVFRGNGGFYEAVDLPVVGILNCPNPNVNRTLAMIPLETADDYLAMEGAVTEINLKLADRADVEADVRKIESLLKENLPGAPVAVMSWRDLARDYLALAEAKRGGTRTILFLIFIIAAVGISNTMMMAIFERTRELGMMRSLGMGGGKIMGSFLIEAAGIGIIGSLMGIFLGFLINLFLVNIGIDYTFFIRDMDIGYRIQGVMRGVWNIDTMVQSLVVGVIISTLVAIIPTSRALKMDIPACLRFQ